MIPVLDDLESSPGSTTSLLRTIVGTSLRRLGGWIAVADLVQLMEVLEISATRTRTALSRVKAKGLLVPSARGGVPGYELAPAAVPMLERGDRRIHHPRAMEPGDRWCLISWSVPEENRDRRHQLRRRLSWIGCGSVSAGLSVGPEYLADEAESILADLGLRASATVFLVNEVRAGGDLRAAIAQWWDLTAIQALHEAFLTAHADQLRALGPAPAPRQAFAAWIRGLDSWRIVPYLDPGLPAELLPPDWPGRRSVPVFLELRERVLPLAHAYVDQVTRSNLGTGAQAHHAGVTSV